MNVLLHAGTCLWVLRPFIWHTLSEHLLYAKLHIRLSLYHGDADFTQPFPTTVGISLGQRGCSFTHLFISLSLKIFPKCKVSVLAQSQGFSFWTGHCTEMFFFFFPEELLLDSKMECLTCNSFCLRSSPNCVTGLCAWPSFPRLS